jgi:MFS family permease
LKTGRITAMFPYIAKTSPKTKTGLYMGSIVASGTLGAIFGRVFMGLLTSIAGWHISFRIVALSVFAYRPECTKRIYRKRLIFLRKITRTIRCNLKM